VFDSKKMMVGLATCIVLAMSSAHALSPSDTDMAYQWGTHVNEAKFCKVEQRYIDEYIKAFYCMAQLRNMTLEIKQEHRKHFEKAIQELPNLQNIKCDEVQKLVVLSNEANRTLKVITQDMKCGSDKFRIKQ
jgi:hypothetical protein